MFAQRSVEQEEILRKHTESLQLDRAELLSCISELEEENLNLRQYLQELTGAGKLTFTSHSFTYLDEAFMEILKELTSSIFFICLFLSHTHRTKPWVV